MAFIEVDRPFVERILEIGDRLRVRVSPVQLRPCLDVLEQRVVAPSRASAGKIGDVGTLRSYLETADPYSMIGEGDLVVDNADLSPEQVARLVGRHLGLRHA